MRCLILLSFVIAQSAMAADWDKLSKLQDPPGRPSLRAAETATQGMTKTEILQRYLSLSYLQKAGSKAANGTVNKLLKREVELLEVALYGQ